MKKIATLFTILFAMILVLDSCSVQKRYHRKGFTVNWNNASVKMNKNRKVVHSESIQKDIVVSNSKKTEKLTKTYQAPAKNYIVHNDTSHPSAIDLSLNNSEAKIRDKISNKESSTRELSKIEVKSTIKDAKAIIKAIKKEQKKQGANTDIVLLVLLAILLPPLAVYLYEGYWTDRCTINLILTLLCGLGIIHALVVILGNR
tara:strand:- start:58 stop:663 length:606 start_codon:yes stop_codon:yes gene_type:complete